MKDSIRRRLERQAERWEELGRALADPSMDGGSTLYRESSVEYARLAPLAERWHGYLALEADQAAARALAGDTDPGMRALGEE